MVTLKESYSRILNSFEEKNLQEELEGYLNEYFLILSQYSLSYSSFDKKYHIVSFNADNSSEKIYMRINEDMSYSFSDEELFIECALSNGFKEKLRDEILNHAYTLGEIFSTSSKKNLY